MDPLIVRWDRTVIHPEQSGEDTIVCCLTLDGLPVALVLDDELREALGLALVDPDGQLDQPDGEAGDACHCPDGPDVHQVGCPQFNG